MKRALQLISFFSVVVVAVVVLVSVRFAYFSNTTSTLREPVQLHYELDIFEVTHLNSVFNVDERITQHCVTGVRME